MQGAGCARSSAGTDEFSVSRRKGAIEDVARLAGLLAVAGEYEYHGSDSASYSGYFKKGDKLDLNEALAHGWADFRGDLTPALTFWARLANQRGEPVALPETLTRESVLAWARAEFAASDAAEGQNSPNASHIPSPAARYSCPGMGHSRPVDL